MIFSTAKKRSSRKPSDEDFCAEDTAEDASSKRRGVKRTMEDMQYEDFHNEGIRELLSELTSHDDAWPFMKPVLRSDIPDYYEKIKKPIDLKTIKMRFSRNKYATDAEFIADVLLIFSNCQQYYGEKDGEYKAGMRLSKFFMRKVKSHKLSNNHDVEDSIRKPAKRKR